MKLTTLFLSATLMAAGAAAQPMIPDSSFGTNGMTQYVWSNQHSVATSMAVQNDDKILVAGYEYNSTITTGLLMRYVGNGNRDSSFGINGRVVVAPGNATYLEDVLVQNDDKILTCGSTINIATSQPILMRYLPNGMTDNSFGSVGRHPLDILYTYASASVVRMLQLPDDRLIIGGNTTTINGEPLMTLVCLKPNGQYDSSFGTNGLARYELEAGKSSSLYCMALQADGKILLGGYTGTASLIAPPDARMAIVRIKPGDGTADSSFGTNGIVALNLTPTAGNPMNVARAIEVMPNGNILVGGSTQAGMALVQLKPDGSKNTVFAQGGELIDMNLPGVETMTLNDGRVTIAGMRPDVNAPFMTDIVMARYFTNGMGDISFGTLGQLTIDHLEQDRAYALSTYDNDKLLIAGHTNYTSTGPEVLTLWRYKADRTGINDTYLPQAQVYPNPAKDVLTIDLGTTPITVIPVQLTDVTGRVVMQTTLTQARQQLDVSALAAGTYLLQLGEGRNTRSMKVVVQ